jgi:hypothetical protein
MKNVTLFWKPRLSQKKRREIVSWIEHHYIPVESNSESITIKAADRDTKFVWIMMISKAFRDIK